MMTLLASREDCTISIDSELNTIFLYDGDGHLLHSFPANTPDPHIWAALAFANKAYSRGVEVGKNMKAYEIRSALDIR